MINNNIKNDSGLLVLAIRLVIGWTYFSAFWRRTILANKLDPEVAGYIGEKFNHFLPNALGIKPLIQYLVENPDILWLNMVIFTIIEGIVGLFIIFGLFTRIMSIGVFGLAMGILLGSGWIGTTCLDEWQIGVLGIATGYVLFLTGSGKYSIDNYFIKNNFSFTKKKWFAWLGSGVIPIKNHIFPKFVLIGSLAILGMTLFTNQVFHGGIWGTLHNKSVKPKLEITEAKISNDILSFDLFRTEGVDVYGSWVISVELSNQQNNTVIQYSQKDLASLTNENILNYYVAKIKPGKHSLVVPLGAKAKMIFKNQVFSNLSNGTYTLKITDISGAFWTHQITK
ncbi:TQO small subunit DoxD [Tenacibaculum mesophilum]|uniref:Quinol oxidase n=1 Tax=Tenacibaculum mesophilum TaxID=104268 RepID=A0ABN5T1P9_9FLAO|nr:TQO small subunit DoxD [Tenacibaculum mesophilum]GFD83190.1 quinol oxidase [Tenacibaculum sp. KUL118]AZJ31191.1 quinol oxidase [Tenacibaculum mesophilum]QFS29238.1 quinol oxidase [Tenacibaculum mesophilum]SHF50245.1 thiosulfate dehydrogenase [quinone] large subunit [Tenacibaculum mesophilum]BFF40499.1 TQO small subunit DoxD [Tenacibaculum mesophilum]